MFLIGKNWFTFPQTTPRKLFKLRGTIFVRLSKLVTFIVLARYLVSETYFVSDASERIERTRWT
jgi:hypothetical protein